MSVSEEHIRTLLRRFADNQASETEIVEMLTLLRSDEGDAVLESFIMELRDEATDATGQAVNWDIVWSSIQKRIQPAVVRKLVWMRVAAAVVILLLLSVGGYLYLKQSPQKQIAQSQQRRFKNDVAPGGNKAILTLSNGTQIILDSAANGALTQQGSTKVIKLDSSQLVYEPVTLSASKGGEAGIGFNIISTPRGGQFQIVLADGSKIWLNAASSLRYPTSFTGKERNVELTGEGYFEVVHNATKPFKVSVNGINVQVLGTHFNINAYDDESVVKTTLLEGSVKVGKGSASKVIKPGEQALIENHGNPLIPKIMIQTVDTDEAVAWKEGRFYFDGADIKTVMRQLSRWYDVDVIYQSEIPDLFVAKIARDVPVSKFLNLLELTNLVHFKIEGNKVIVMK